MTHLYGLNSCFYDNCDKKNNNKRKGRKKTRKKTHVRRDLNVGPLSQHYGFTTRPRGLSHLYLACSARIFFLRKRMLKLEKRGENGASQKERGRGREERRENACPKTLWNERHPLIIALDLCSGNEKPTNQHRTTIVPEAPFTSDKIKINTSV